jgi:hypothetical protein
LSLLQAASVRTPYQSSADDLGWELFLSTDSNLPLISTSTDEPERVLPSIRVFHYSIAAEEILNGIFTVATGTQSRQEQHRQQFLSFRERAIRVPDISPEVLIEVADDRNLEFCLFEVLSRLKEELLNDSRAKALSVTRLRDPEGTELRIYFEVRTAGLSYHDRRSIRTKLERTIDRVVEDAVDDKHFVDIRVIFGVTMKQGSEG